MLISGSQSTGESYQAKESVAQPNLVAQFIDTQVFGGAEVIAVELCRRLSTLGYQTRIYHFGNDKMELRCDALGVEHIRLDNWIPYKSWKTLPKFAWQFATRLRADGVTLLHSHLFGSVIGGTMAAQIARVPHVGTLHDFYTLEEAASRVRSLQICSHLGTRLVTVADTLEQYCRDHAWFMPGRMRTIHNGIQAAGHDARARSELRGELSIDDRQVVFICAGRLVALKNHRLLIEAVASLPQDSRLLLLIVGEGPEESALKALAAEKNVNDKVKFLGFRTDVERLLSASDCLSLVSSSEGLSCAILEAMSCGLPIVCSRVGGNAELVSDGENGYLISAGVEELAAKMQLIAGDAGLRKRLAEESLRRCKRLFSFEQMIDQYRALYSELSKSFG